MKNYPLFIIAVLISFSIHAQEYFPKGATWNYHTPSYTSASFTYTTIESKRDSIFNGDTLTYLEGYVECATGWNELFKQNGNKIYKLNKCDSTFSLLYDFGANVGDTIIVPLDTCGTYHSNDTILLKVDSINTININGNILNHFFITQLNPFLGLYFDGNIIEGIGNTTSFYPLIGFCDPNGGPLRCYNDTVIGEYNSGLINGSCDTSYSVGFNEIENSYSVNIFPNPTTNKIKVSSTKKINRIDVIDIRGVQLISTKEKEIDLSILPKGMYLLKIHLSNEFIYQKVLKE